MSEIRQPFELLEGQGAPTVRQVSVFLENRVGQLLRLTQEIEERHVKILALVVIDSVDYAVVRLLFDSPDVAVPLLKKAGFAVSINEMMVVKLPPGERGLMAILAALLSAEVNIGYTYPLLTMKAGPAVALSVDNLEMAADTLRRHKFTVLGEAELQE